MFKKKKKKLLLELNVELDVAQFGAEVNGRSMDQRMAPKKIPLDDPPAFLEIVFTVVRHGLTDCWTALLDG